MSCPFCGAARGSNKYCWNHVTGSGEGYLLPDLSDRQLIRSVELRVRRVGGRREGGVDGE